MAEMTGFLLLVLEATGSENTCVSGFGGNGGGSVVLGGTGGGGAGAGGGGVSSCSSDVSGVEMW